MYIRLQDDVFAPFPDWNMEDPFAMEFCAPAWNEASREWVWEKPLGECGMELTTIRAEEQSWVNLLEYRQMSFFKVYRFHQAVYPGRGDQTWGIKPSHLYQYSRYDV